MTHEERYVRDVAAFDALRAVIPKFKATKSYFRNTERVTRDIQREMGPSAPLVGSNRDHAVCALVNKACNTHAAIRLLTDAGHGDDAMALGRVILENTVILKWLLIDPVYRLDLYCISDALFRKRWCELVIEHCPEDSDVVAQAKASLDAEVKAVAGYFGDTIHRWAQVLHPNGKHQRVNFEAMMKEVAEHGGASGSAATFRRDVIYFLHSGFVHSTASSMRSFRHLRTESYFTLALGPNASYRDEALGQPRWEQLPATLSDHHLGGPRPDRQVVLGFRRCRTRRRILGRWTENGREDLTGLFVIQCKLTSRSDYVVRRSELTDEVAEVSWPRN